MKCLVILPFNPEAGVSGRKSEIIYSMLKVIEGLGYELVIFEIPGSSTSAPLGPQGIFMRLLRKALSLFGDLGNHFTLRIYASLCMVSSDKSMLDDVILIYSMSFWATATEVAAGFALSKKLPYIIHDHRTEYQRALESNRRVRGSLTYAMRKAALVLALTASHKESICKISGAANVEVLRLPLELNFYRPQFIRTKSKTFVLGAATNWRPIKRLDLLIDAFRQVIGTGLDAILKIAGPIDDGVRENFPNLPNVIFMGELNRREVRSLLSCLDLLVVSSDHETLGLPVMEAMSFGCPVVTTRCGGPEELLSDARARGVFAGLSVDRGCSKRLADAILLMSDSEVNREQIANYASNYFGLLYAQNNLRNLIASKEFDQ